LPPGSPFSGLHSPFASPLAAHCQLRRKNASVRLPGQGPVL